jgi:hypothetical protein
MLQTLGDVVTCGMVIIAVLVLPAAIARAWWPEVRRAGVALIGMFMSNPAPVPELPQNRNEHRSYAENRPAEPSGTEERNAVPDLVELLSDLDDDALLDILARLRDADGAYRFAESRVAKFIPGKVEDRLTQVREVRHTEKPPPPGRTLRIRDAHGERVIPIKAR